ncbi:hypothetical protein GGI11_002876 [Coemansia sp. RSA 2049]|nr:hypothetical protein GGI11_002876 [Coemansia sp. RSA 2049]
MEDLAARLEVLERGVYSSTHLPTGEESENLVSQVALIEHKLNRALSENATLSKDEKLRSIIDDDGALEHSRRLLGIGAKAELIMLNDTALQTVSDMRSIGDLQAQINRPEYSKAAEQQTRARAVEQQHNVQASEFRAVAADISSVIDRYYAETEVLSEMFVQWDQALTAIERKVADLESISRKQQV